MIHSRLGAGTLEEPLMRSFGACSALIVCLICGCGGGGGDPGGRLAISGTVHHKGEPVQNGSIEFVPHPGVKTQSGSTITNGRFSIPKDQGLEPGAYTVKISSMETVAVGEPGGLPGPDPKELIPAKYNTKSTLTKEVKPGETSFEFKLE
jgi:hypothetical protein